ncbi:SDR family NAD(P)-dependent oxidoreductase [Kribbella sp. NPDC054772]
MDAWGDDDIHDQQGRTAVVTGANSGLGLRAATVLAAKGARVILACRSRERGERAAAAVGGELVVLDLQHRLRAEGSSMLSVAAHPGFTATEIAAAGARNQGLGAFARPLNAMTKAMSQPVSEGTLPVLYAATAPDVQGGDYYGPRRFGEFYRGVGPARIDPRAQDQALRARLWRRTAELTGVHPDPN